MAEVEAAFEEERDKLAAREAGNRRGGWSAAYWQLLVQIQELVALAKAVPDASPQTAPR